MWLCLVAGLADLRKLKALDLSRNEFTGWGQLQGKFSQPFKRSIKNGSGENSNVHILISYSRDLRVEKSARARPQP